MDLIKNLVTWELVQAGPNGLNTVNVQLPVEVDPKNETDFAAAEKLEKTVQEWVQKTRNAEKIAVQAGVNGQLILPAQKPAGTERD